MRKSRTNHDWPESTDRNHMAIADNRQF
jgi:hypothetical protein